MPTPTPFAEWLSPSFPIAQRQSVQQIVSTLASSGFGTGFDFGIDPSWSGPPGSVPEFQLTFSYPTRGRTVGATGLIIDLAQGTDYEWDEDATQSMNSIYATASGTGASAGASGNSGLPVGTPINVVEFAAVDAGYPLMEATVSNTEINTQDALLASALGSLGQLMWPVVAPVITLPMFSNGTYPQIGDFIMGDNIRVSMPTDDRFPGGMNTNLATPQPQTGGFDIYMRVIAVTYTIPDEGLPTMALTMNMPLSAAPVPQSPL